MKKRIAIKLFSMLAAAAVLTAVPNGLSVSASESSSVTLEDETAAYDYLLEEMQALADFGMGFEFYGTEEIDAQECFIFDLNYWYGEGDYDYEYLHEVAVSPDGEIYLPSIGPEGGLGDWAPGEETVTPPSGMYYLDGDKEMGSVEFLDGGAMTLKSPDNMEHIDGQWALNGDRAYVVAVVEEAYYPTIMRIEDETTLYEASGQIFKKDEAAILTETDETDTETDTETVIEITDGETAYAHLSQEFAGAIEMGLEPVFYNTQMTTLGSAEGSYVFELYFRYGGGEDDTDYLFDIAVSPSGAFMYNDYYADWVDVSGEDAQPAGVYNLIGEEGVMIFNNGGELELYAPGEETEEISAAWTSGGRLVFLKLESEENVFFIAMEALNDDALVTINDAPVFFKKSPDGGKGLLKTAVSSDIIGKGFDFNFERYAMIDNEEAWVYTLVWDNGEGGEVIDSFAVSESFDIFTVDAEGSEWMPVEAGEYEINGYYFLNGDEAETYFYFYSDGTLDYYDGESETAGEYLVIGNVVYLTFGDEGERQFGAMLIQDNDTLMLSDTESYIAVEVEEE